MRVYAILERYRRIRRSYDVIIFDVTSHPTFFRKHTSAEPIRIKIGRIVHFDEKKFPKKFQTDADIFDGVVTSSSFDVTSILDDVTTPSKMSESI